MKPLGFKKFYESKTKEITLYQFSELSDKVKEKVKDNFMNNIGYTWGDDAIESLKKGAEAFGGKLVDYSIDFFNTSQSYARFDMPELTHEEIKEVLDELGKVDSKGKGVGDCKLTGYCADEDFLDGIREKFKTSDDINELMDNGFHSWLVAVQKDVEYQYEDENFGEFCDANDYWFDENGNLEINN
jgi:hypothetical protein